MLYVLPCYMKELHSTEIYISLKLNITLTSSDSCTETEANVSRHELLHLHNLYMLFMEFTKFQFELRPNLCATIILRNLENRHILHYKSNDEDSRSTSNEI